MNPNRYGSIYNVRGGSNGGGIPHYLLVGLGVCLLVVVAICVCKYMGDGSKGAGSVMTGKRKSAASGKEGKSSSKKGKGQATTTGSTGTGSSSLPGAGKLSSGQPVTSMSAKA